MQIDHLRARTRQLAAERDEWAARLDALETQLGAALAQGAALQRRHEEELQAQERRHVDDQAALTRYLLHRHDQLMALAPRHSIDGGGLPSRSAAVGQWVSRLTGHAATPTPPTPRRWPEEHAPVADRIRESMLFDAQWYVDRYTDAAAYGGDPASHYAVLGGPQGHDPSPWFSTLGYLRDNPDVAQAKVNALYHYELHGRHEGRRLRPAGDPTPADSGARDPATERASRTDPPESAAAAPGNSPATTVPASHDQGTAAFRSFQAPSPVRLVLPRAADPAVSIVLVLHHEAEQSLACLRALAEPMGVPCEVILVARTSDAGADAWLADVEGARVLAQPGGPDRGHPANAGATAAQGRHLLFLREDTQVHAGAISAACALLDSEPDIGAVGAKVVGPDGRLREAGSIVWRDGASTGYGDGEKADASPFQFRRDVDCGSDAFLMVRRLAFDALAGFDARYGSACDESADLCMRLRQGGWRVVYDPSACVTLGETTKEYRQIRTRRRRDLFVQRHATALRSTHHAPAAGVLRARARPSPRGRLLFIDDQVPVPELGSGLPRAFRLLNELMAAGAAVTHYPLQLPTADARAASLMLVPGLECVVDERRPTLADFLRERRGHYDTVLVSRPHNMAQFLRCCDEEVSDFLEDTRLVYDAEAVFAPREALRLRLLGDEDGNSGAYDLPARLAEELALAARASTVIAVSDAEAAQFIGSGCLDVHVIGHAIDSTPTAAGFEARDGLLFLGRLLDAGSPNVDSLRWFVHDAMPLLDGRIGTQWHLDVVGACSPELREELGSARVRFHGRLPAGPETVARYEAARVFIAPTRFAAGIPHKVHEAAAHGLPVVATALLAKQVGWEDGEALCVADTAEAFADACARLYRDPALWARVRAGALQRVEHDCSPLAARRRIRALLDGRPAG